MNHRKQARTIRKRWIADDHVAPGEQHLVNLPSADPSLCFEVTLVVKYRWAGVGAPPPSTREIAAEGVSQRAEELSRGHLLTECERLRGKLAIALLSWEDVGGTGVQAQAHCASVTADPELTSAVAAREAAAGRQAALSWQYDQRERAAARLRSLIVDPLRATAWWFADNQDSVDKLSEVAKEFQAVQGLLSPSAEEDSPGRLLDEYLASIDGCEGYRLQLRLMKVFEEVGRGDLVERLDAVARDSSDGPAGN